jgi:hypothetical protein
MCHTGESRYPVALVGYSVFLRVKEGLPEPSSMACLYSETACGTGTQCRYGFQKAKEGNTCETPDEIQMNARQKMNARHEKS